MAALFDRDVYKDASRNLQRDRLLKEPQEEHDRLGWPTICGLIVNRTVGSGIFVTPVYIIRATGSIGQALTLWAAGGLISICATLVWNEFGLAIPRHEIKNVEGEHSLPRNGGEKNFLEWVYYRPRYLMQCVFGIIFLFLGNLSGNALAFGSYILKAYNYNVDSQNEPTSAKWEVIALGIAACTIAVVWHMLSRIGGVYVNNAYAVLKIVFLVAIIILGAVQGAQGALGGKDQSPGNFIDAWPNEGSRTVGDYAQALIYVLYTYSGFEQPFYVLAECSNPRKTFPIATVCTMFAVTILFLGVNVAYCLVVPKSVILDPDQSQDMATLFLTGIFPDAEAAKQAMASLIAVMIFGNILVMTFTASRVKQEIASEGILPKSLYLASGWTTPYALYMRRKERHQLLKQYQSLQSGVEFDEFKKTRPKNDEIFPEQTPLPALLIHWVSSLILIFATSALDSKDAIALLISLYSYVVISLLGFLVAAGLVYLRLWKYKEWKVISEDFNAWGLSPGPALIYLAACGFVLAARFVEPSARFLTDTEYPYILIPALGLSSLGWGILYFGILKGTEWFMGARLEVSREPEAIPDPDKSGKFLMKAERVICSWPGKTNN